MYLRKPLLHKYSLVVYTQILFSAENCAVSRQLLHIQKLPVLIHTQILHKYLVLKIVLQVTNSNFANYLINFNLTSVIT